MNRSIQVAQAIIKLANDQDISITNLKLQKLAYIAHGYSLAINGSPLLDEQPQAWRYGPVIRSIYQEYKSFGAETIPLKGNNIQVSKDEESLLIAVLQTYGQSEAVELVNLTHQSDTPWYQIWHDNSGKDQLFAEIPNELIQAHFMKAYTNPESVQGL